MRPIDLHCFSIIHVLSPLGIVVISSDHS